MTTGEFAEAVKTYCLLMGASTTSFGRTTKHNRDVGGVAHSAHRYWLGMDVVYDAPVAEGVRIETTHRLGLKLIIEGDHDHLQPFDWEAG